MNQEATQTFSGHQIRWPFRILAGLVVATGLAVLLHWALAIWLHGVGSLKDMPGFDLLFLPAFAWMLNNFAPAALHGRGARQPHWPFASDGVFTVYILLLLFFKGL